MKSDEGIVRHTVFQRRNKNVVQPFLWDLFFICLNFIKLSSMSRFNIGQLIPGQCQRQILLTDYPFIWVRFTWCQFRQTHHRHFFFQSSNHHVRADAMLLKAFGRLLLQSSAFKTPTAGRWVVTLSRPWHRSSAAGRPSTPTAPAAINGYCCQKKPWFLSLFQFPRRADDRMNPRQNPRLC